VSADPQLLVSYLWYGVYHHIDAPERQLQIAQSALPYLKKYDRHMLAPSLAVRLAQAFYNGENYSEAAKMAALAINDPQTAAEALWMRGVAYAKSKNYPLAIKDFEKLLANYPQSSFIVNAQQELGVIYEQNGQIVEAAALYLSTNHLSDARYVMDILLSPDQLIQLRQHPRLTLAGRDEVSFALASKYMLTLALDKAAIEFRQIKAPAKPQNAQIDQDYYLGTERDRMLQVINELQPRLAAVDTAKSYAEKAQALYQVGAYIYHKNNKNHNRHAIFNNALMSYWDSPYYAYLHIHPDERQLRQRRFLQANLLLRAEEYFRIVALQYPQSTVAAKALYSAALCNTWYPDYHPAVFDYQDNQASTARINAAEAQAIEYLQLLIKRYPDHSLVPEAKGLLSVLAVNREDRYRRLYFENNSETPSQNSDSPDNQDE
jgi:outer membrane protein assembly factor BamD (BamD/ComL family)